MHIQVRKNNWKDQICSASSVLSIKYLSPSEKFLQASCVLTRDPHVVEINCNITMEISNSAVSLKIIFIRQGFLCVRTVIFLFHREVIIHGHVHIWKTGEVQNSLHLSWPLCNRLVNFIYIICSSLLYPEVWKWKSYTQSSSRRSEKAPAESSQLGVGLPEVSFRSLWSVCDDVPDVDVDVSSENLVTTERFRSFQSNFSLLKITALGLKF